MDTQILKDGRKDKGSTPSETPSAFLCCDGSAGESLDSTMANWMREYDPRIIFRSLATTYHRWISEGREPGSDLAILGTRTERPQAAVEVQKEWERLSDSDPRKDQCPYSDRAILIKWAAFRRLKKPQKNKWFEFFGLRPVSKHEEGEA